MVRGLTTMLFTSLAWSDTMLWSWHAGDPTGDLFISGLPGATIMLCLHAASGLRESLSVGPYPMKEPSCISFALATAPSYIGANTSRMESFTPHPHGPTSAHSQVHKAEWIGVRLSRCLAPSASWGLNPACLRACSARRALLY